MMGNQNDRMVKSFKKKNHIFIMDVPKRRRKQLYQRQKTQIPSPIKEGSDEWIFEWQE